MIEKCGKDRVEIGYMSKYPITTGDNNVLIETKEQFQSLSERDDKKMKLTKPQLKKMMRIAGEYGDLYRSTGFIAVDPGLGIIDQIRIEKNAFLATFDKYTEQGPYLVATYNGGIFFCMA